MRATLVADGTADVGGSPFCTHNERLADPLDPFVRALREITQKRKKTDADHEEMARLEWHAGLYTEPTIANPGDVNGQLIIVPAWNVIRALQDGARRHKRGIDVLRGVHPIDSAAAFTFFGVGPDVAGLWSGGQHFLRKTVGVQRARTMRTRPFFTEWGARLTVEVDPIVFDLDQLAAMWRDAGRYAGLGEMRPIYGRFLGTIEVDGVAL